MGLLWGTCRLQILRLPTTLPTTGQTTPTTAGALLFPGNPTFKAAGATGGRIPVVVEGVDINGESHIRAGWVTPSYKSTLDQHPLLYVRQPNESDVQPGSQLWLGRDLQPDDIDDLIEDTRLDFDIGAPAAAPDMGTRGTTAVPCLGHRGPGHSRHHH